MPNPKPHRVVSRYLDSVASPCGEQPHGTGRIVWASECGLYRARETATGITLQFKSGRAWYDDETWPDLKSILRELRMAAGK